MLRSLNFGVVTRLTCYFLHFSFIVLFPSFFFFSLFSLFVSLPGPCPEGTSDLLQLALIVEKPQETGSASRQIQSPPIVMLSLQYTNHLALFALLIFLFPVTNTYALPFRARQDGSQTLTTVTTILTYVSLIEFSLESLSPLQR